MTRHNREKFLIVGEGVLAADGPGSMRTRAPSTTEELRDFRFSRLGPEGHQHDPATLLALAQAMTAETQPDPDSAGIPSGFTYLAQFVDHDMTKDVTGTALGTDVTVDELLQGRSPALDLDSVYGRGPFGAESHRFYDGRARLRVGTTSGAPFPAPDAFVAAPHEGFDLPRVGATGLPGETTGDKRQPQIPDARNDENLAVAQTHQAFIRFHNRVVDDLASQHVPVALRFPRARGEVVRHYQWMLTTDFLPRIVDPAIIEDVFADGRKVFETGPFDPAHRPTMPVEFSVAAYRLGHSMVRGAYEWNRVFNSGGPGPIASLLLLFSFTGVNGFFEPESDVVALDEAEGTKGILTLPSNWIVDFRRLYDFVGETGRADLAPPATPDNPAGLNIAKRIDTRLVDPLAFLPLGSFGGRGTTVPDPQRNLAFRNLLRANMMKLASGQDMVAVLQAAGVPVVALKTAEILQGSGGADLSGLTPAQQADIVAHTPLWFYILREAELNNGRLTGVGGRLVAEVFHRAIEGSGHSIVRDAAWRPSFGPDEDTFRMVDLLLFGAAGSVDILNPLGDTASVPAPV